MHLTVLFILVASANAINAGGDGQLEEVAKLEKTLREHPGDALAHYQLGIVYRELGDNRSATLNLEAAIHGGFDNLGAKLNLIEAAFACRRSTLALETAKQVIATVKSVSVLLRVGRLLFDHLFYKDAVGAFESAEQLAPGAFEPRFRLALTYYLLEDYAGTLGMLRPATALSAPSSPEAVSLEAAAEAASGHFESAVSLLRAAIEKTPQSPHLYVNLALIELDRGNAREAEAVLAQFRTLGTHVDAKVFYRVRRNSCPEIATVLRRGIPFAASLHDKSDFYYQLASQLQKGFNFLSALELIRLAQANEGNSARVLLVAGSSCLNQDPMSPDAVSLLNGAVARDAGAYEAYYLLGRAYARQGRTEDAIRAYRRAAELHPDASYYVSLGKALKNRQSAIAEFERALSLDSSDAQAHLELGRTYVELGELDKARLHLEKAIALEPDFYEADYLLGRLLHQLGNEDQSHKMLKLFAEKKAALMQQSVIGSGYVGDGR